MPFILHSQASYACLHTFFLSMKRKRKITLIWKPKLKFGIEVILASIVEKHKNTHKTIAPHKSGVCGIDHTVLHSYSRSHIKYIRIYVRIYRMLLDGVVWYAVMWCGGVHFTTWSMWLNECVHEDLLVRIRFPSEFFFLIRFMPWKYCSQNTTQEQWKLFSYCLHKQPLTYVVWKFSAGLQYFFDAFLMYGIAWLLSIPFAKVISVIYIII